MKQFAAALCCLCVLALTLSLPAATKPTVSATPPRWFWGCWVVKKDLAVKDISGLSQKQVEAFVGTRIVLTSSCARWKRTVITSPKYSVRVLSNSQFFSGTYGTYNTLKEIGVHGQYVTQVTLDLPGNLSDLNFPGAVVYLREKDIVIEVEGDYMVAKKAKPGDPTCTCSDAGAGQKERPKK